MLWDTSIDASLPSFDSVKCPNFLNRQRPPLTSGDLPKMDGSTTHLASHWTFLYLAQAGWASYGEASNICLESAKG